MMTLEETQEALRRVKTNLIKAHDEISGVADRMEARLTTESERANTKEYGIVCYTLGILEEQIAEVSKLTRLNK